MTFGVISFHLVHEHLVAAAVVPVVYAAAMVVTAYALAHGSIQLVIGPVGDRFGKYRTVALMCAIGAVLVACCGLAGSLSQLMLARLATGRYLY